MVSRRIDGIDESVLVALLPPEDLGSVSVEAAEDAGPWSDDVVAFVKKSPDELASWVEKSDPQEVAKTMSAVLQALAVSMWGRP